MSQSIDDLKSLQPQHEFFVGIDSDGCIFDSMEIKHKECFVPEFILHFDLQAVSKYARETWEFVNLYSKTRGVNRFRALIFSLAALGERQAVRDRDVSPRRLPNLAKWTETESKLGNATLEAEAKRTGDPELQDVLAWSNDVNAAVKRIVHGVPPFPLVRESLQKLTERADAIVCSQTPTEALVREWEEHGIDAFVRCIAGQELGTKAQHLEMAAQGKYGPDKALMVGDAPGDLKAARANNFLFYPIVPGSEEVSWKRFHDEAIDRFFSGKYAGKYEDSLIAEFEARLPEDPPWQD